jgi:hypothetical protein
MIRQGCKGIRTLIDSHPESTIVIACNTRWAPVVRSELPEVEIYNGKN